MKWNNKDKTIGINLDLIPFWKFNAMGSYGSPEIQLYFTELEPTIFFGTEAKEIYNMLTSDKQIL